MVFARSRNSCGNRSHSVPRGIGGLVRRAIHKQSQKRIDNYEEKRPLLYRVAFSLLGGVLFALGFMLIFKSWTPANFDPAANVHMTYRILSAAALIWGGMGIWFWVFGMLP